MEEKKEEKKKRSLLSTVIIILIMLITILIYFWIRRPFPADMSFNESVLYICLGAGMVIIIAFLAIFKNTKTVIYTTTWLKHFFRLVVWPGMFAVIIFLGALQVMYPIENPPLEPAQLQQNLTFTMNITSNAMVKATDSIVTTLYNLGRGNPAFWIYLIIVDGCYSLYLSFEDTKDEIKSPKDAQEILDQITKEDPEKEKEKTSWIFWVILGIIILIGVYLWIT